MAINYLSEIETNTVQGVTYSSMRGTTNPINAPVWNSVDTQNISDENKKLLVKYLQNKNIVLTKEEVEKATEMLRQSAEKTGLDLNKLSDEEKIFYSGLIIEMQRGNLTADEVVAITAEYGNDEVKAKVKALNLENGGGINEEKLNKYKKEIAKLAQIHSVMAENSAKQIYGKDKEDTGKLREEFLIRTQKSLAERTENQIKAAIDALPDNCTKEDAQKIIENTGVTYGTNASESLITLTKSAGYSSKLITSLTDIATKFAETLHSRIAKITDWFFKTSKGKNLKEQYVQNRKECREAVAKAEIKKEEAKEAEENAEKAIEQAELAQKKAEQTIANLGLKDLNDKQFDKVLKNKSYKNWRNLQDANAAKEKAYWEAYDANSAKRLATEACKWAYKNLMVTCSQIHASISGLLG